ncbi:MAG: outer membrane beta-barrel family protein, partial [Flavobacteriales bacterium]|nr:outer membrane beta-barrel family protein [Flavobacteriales bacterium]
DPDGMAGIINIVLKKSSLKGNYGGIRASIGTNDKYNGNINFNYRNDRVSVFANMNASHRRFENLGLVDRETFTTDTTFYLHQWKYGYNYRDVAGALVGLDWYVNDRNTLTLSFNGNRSQRMRLDNFENHFRDENNAARLFNDRNAINDHLGSNETYRIQYIKQFEDIKRNLFIDLVYMNAYDTGLYSTQEVFLYQDTSTLLDWINDYDHRLQRLVFQLDYEHPLPKDQTLEFGLKSINNQFNSDFIQYVRDPETKEYLENAILTNNFRFRESQNTAYGIYKKKYKNFGFQLGARLEQTITDNKVLQIDTIYNKNYFSLFPSGHISYALSDQEDLKFSYSKRINRPNFHALKPYADVSDPLNLRFGNPDLNPEFVDSYEIGHLKRWAKGITLTNSIYYKHVTDVIRSIRRVDSEGISTLTQENLNSSDSYGYEVIFSGQVIKWLRLNFSLNAFRTVFNGDNLVGDGVGQEGFGWNSNLGAFVKLQEDLQIQFNYKYVDPGAHSQGIILPRHMMELAVSKKILDKKGSIALRATDVFNTKIFRFNSRGPGYYHEGTFKWETQIAYASFSYKFGNQKLQKKKAKKKSTEQKIRKTGDEL